MSSENQLKNIVEAALLAAGRPLGLDALLALFLDDEQPDRAEVRKAIETLSAEYAERGIRVRQVGSGWRIEVRSELSPWVSRLWEEKPPRYSRALLETLALIAYRQPITRGEIEEIRGVSVSTNIVKTLQEREWVRVVGHRDVPGRPALYATTRAFLDHFGLRGLDDLPTLAEIKDVDSLNKEFSFVAEDTGTTTTAPEEAGPPVEAGVVPPGSGEGQKAADLPGAGEAEGSGAAASLPDAVPDEEAADEPAVVVDVTH